MGIFKAPEIKEVMGVNFTPISSLRAIEWARDYQLKKIILPRQDCNDACYDRLSNLEKAGLIVYNSFKASFSIAGSWEIEPDLYNPEHVAEIERLYPFIEKLSEMKIAVAIRPICTHNRRVHSMDTASMRGRVIKDILYDWAPSIEYLKNEMLIGRSIIVYYAQFSSTIFTTDPEEEESRGLMLRYKRYI